MILHFSSTDSSCLFTKTLQGAIDKVSAGGGGRVVLDAGVFRTGMLHLRDGVELCVERGAVLKASGRVEDHLPLLQTKGNGDFWHQSEGSFHLLAAQGCRNVALTGRGRLDTTDLQGWQSGNGVILEASDWNLTSTL